MEIWDLFDENENILQGKCRRGIDRIPDGAYHLVVCIIIRHKDGSFLMMKRDENKNPYPGWLEIGAGGSVISGETVEQGAAREVKEETGIIVSNLKKIFRYIDRNKHFIYYGFLTIVDCDKNAIVYQEGETCGHIWYTKEELIQHLQSDNCIPSQKKYANNDIF